MANKKMKVLAVGDLHGDSSLAKKVAKQAEEEKVDLIIIPGDLTWLEQDVKNLIKPFDKLNKRILVLPGNHETIPTIQSFEDAYKNVRNLHGSSFLQNGVGFFGAGYSTTSGPFWIEEDELSKLLNKAHSEVKNAEKKVMITHMHPLGSSSEITGFGGSESVLNAIKKFKPDLVINGHIHEAGGLIDNFYGTKIVNVARRPMIFEI